MSLLIGALTIGFILSLLALGVLISFRIFAFPDITAEGSLTLGAAVAATLLVSGMNPPAAPLVAVLASGLAGAATGILHTKFKINGLLSGILVMTALYSVNLHVMGRSNVPLLSARTFVSQAEELAASLLSKESVNLAGWDVSARDLSVAALHSRLHHRRCLSDVPVLSDRPRDRDARHRRQQPDDPCARRQRRQHDHPRARRVQRPGRARGALLAQYQGFADVQMGIGMVVWGLASVIIGEALVGVTQLGYLDRRGGDGVGAVPPAGRDRPAVGTEPERSEAHHRGVCVRRAGPARVSLGKAEGRGRRRLMLDSKRIRKTFNPGTPNEVRALQGVA